MGPKLLIVDRSCTEWCICL